MKKKTYLLQNAILVNEGKIQEGSLLIENGKIAAIYNGLEPNIATGAEKIDVKGAYLIPGAIDDQVHFREPGLTQKACIYSESKAAIAGGITSFMDMPNTIPNTTTQNLLEDKFKIAAEKSLANFSFFMGATNDNLTEVLQTNPNNVCGIKIFMGSSTGNMLVDNQATLAEIFKQSNMLIAVHCEDENTIQNNLKIFQEKYGEQILAKHHPLIRSADACFLSSKMAVDLAKEHNTRLHILHISTEKELILFENKLPLKDKKITAEVCIHHLWFNDNDYEKKGMLIKWNPAVKTEQDQKALLEALNNNTLDIIATDHAPHTWDEKQQIYTKAPSGAPMVQHALPTMLELFAQQKITLEKIVEKMCHAPAICFNIAERGFLKEGYYADLSVVKQKKWEVNKSNILYQCGWSPLEGQIFSYQNQYTFVNGNWVYNNGKFDESQKGMRLLFNKK